MPSGAKKRKAARRKKENVHGAPPPHSPTDPPPGSSESHDHHRHKEDSASSGEEEVVVTPMDGFEAARDEDTTKDKEVAEKEESAVPVSLEAQEVSVDLIQPEMPEGAPELGVVEDSSAAVVPADGPVPSNEAVVEVAEAAAETSKTCIKATAPSVVPADGPPPANEEVAETAAETPKTCIEVTAPSVAPADGPLPANLEVVEVAEAAAETSQTSIDVESLSHETEEKPVPILNNLVSEAPRESSQLRCATRESEVSATLVEHRAIWWNCCGLFDVLTGSKGNIRT